MKFTMHMKVISNRLSTACAASLDMALVLNTIQAEWYGIS
jgi:hypothetical protein